MTDAGAIFVDTSALVALLNRDDEHFVAARDAWAALLHREQPLVTSNYVVVESAALVQRRMGMAALAALTDRLLAPVAVRWIDETAHRAALAAVLAAGRRRLSLVDCTSFEVMRSLGVTQAFAFDRHFAHHGFELLP